MTVGHKWDLEVPIQKSVDEWQVVYGWASVTETPDGKVVIDKHGDVIPTEELEAATIEWMLNKRTGGIFHLRDKSGKAVGVGRCVECIVFTAEKRAALGIPDGILPAGLWVGLRIDDPVVWQMHKNGELPMFSIGGRSMVEQVP